MKRLCSFALATLLVMGAFASAHAATEVKMTGDATVYGSFFSGRNFTGWNRTGSATEENFEIWERFRLRSDFVASEAVKFRFGIKVEDTWGHGTYTAANPTAGIIGSSSSSGSQISSGVQVYLAYLQFKWPDCDVQITAGLQPVALPHSAMFNSSPVWDDNMAALTISAPLIPDTLSVLTGFGRLIDANQTFDTTVTSTYREHKADEVDAYFLALPVTLDGFKATPWGMIGVVGREGAIASATDKNTTDITAEGNVIANGLVSGATAMGGYAGLTSRHRLGSWNNAQNAYYWVGGAFEVTALDPIRFYADVIYGAGATTDTKSARREGWFIDAGVEYTGLDMVTPQVFAWWSTGEDKSTGNGSERMPYVRSKWGPGNSFLFDSSQEFGKGGSMNVSPVGNYGIGASLDKISFIEKLTHRLTFMYVRGNNSARALRLSNISSGTFATGSSTYSYVYMGRDLTENESVYGLSFDTKYMIYENLAAVLEAGWAHGNFQESVWGYRQYHHADDLGDNVWKFAVGLSYKF